MTGGIASDGRLKSDDAAASPGAARGRSKCVCAEQQYCAPLQTAPPEHEVFVFALGNAAENETQQRHDYYHAYRWDLITTVGWLKPDNESICWAHKHGARVVTQYSGGFYGSAAGDKQQQAYINLMNNATARSAEVSQLLDNIEALGLDVSHTHSSLHNKPKACCPLATWHSRGLSAG